MRPIKLHNFTAILGATAQRLVLLAICCAGLTCCTARPNSSVTSLSDQLGASDPLRVAALDANAKWWAVRVKFLWPAKHEPDWALDALAANEIFQPILQNHHNDIALWRFHRRAGRDDSGHQFSFIFYSNPITAQAVFAEVDASAVASLLKQRSIIQTLSNEPFSALNAPDISATSDQHWPESIQRLWPIYIMGCSSTWLGLVRAEINNNDINRQSATELLEAYRKASDKVGQEWRNFGQHAFLHHLSAIFGYAPLRIEKDMQF
ncbi:MAG: hypothetical protein K1X79_13730 [Oligoflexia bacterium]|nr:hypothetical protein [Oligoflexia bacterium]